MRPQQITWAVLTVVVFASAVAAQERVPLRTSAVVEATLFTPYTKVLPGVPLEMWIELRNTSDTRMGVGLCADMFVVPPTGDSFWISYGGEERPAYPALLPQRIVGGPPESYIVMKGREARTVTLPFEDTLSGPAYFSDPRLAGPGTYRFSLRLDYCWPGFTVPSDSLLPPEFTGAITTSSLEVERITPEGVDATVWSRLQQAAKDHPIATHWPGVVTSAILTEFKDSQYFPYAAAIAAGRPAKEYVPLVADAIERFPQSPVAELLSESATRLMSTACVSKGRFTNACLKADAALKASKRPTTRMRVTGRTDVPQEPCPKNVDCQD